MIEHQVNYHSSDGDIHPKRQREARDGFVAEEVPALRSAYGDDYEGNDDRRQECMRCKNGEIDRACDSLPCERRHAVMRVIDDVRNQEQHRSRQSRNLAIAVGDDSLSLNEKVAAR